MENQEKQMSHEESLAVIQSMIDTARNNVAEDGFHLLLWGTLVILCSIINYLLLYMNMENIAALPWMIMPVIGVPIALWYERKVKIVGHVKTHLDMHVAYMWWAYSITLFLVIYYSVSKELSPVPFILMITGMVTFATGLMLRFRPLIIGGVIFWICTVISFYLPVLYHLLLEAVSIFLGYIIPGLLLRKLAKESNHV
jgi:hypothetical protein